MTTPPTDRDEMPEDTEILRALERGTYEATAENGHLWTFGCIEQHRGIYGWPVILSGADLPTARYFGGDEAEAAPVIAAFCAGRES